MTARRGPRPGEPDTRDQILAAARAAFAAYGYDRATIRLIASDAGVDPALVHHYFGKKEDLFAAAVEIPIRPVDAVQHVFEAGIDQAAGRLTSLFFRIWENPESREALLGQLRMALSTGRPPPMREFVTVALLERAAARLEGQDRALRVDLVASHLIGVAVLRYLVGIEPLASLPVDRLIQEVTPRVASYLTGDHPSGGGT